MKPVSVMYVDIDNHYFLRGMPFFEIFGTQGDIVKQAESHRLVSLCMMTRRSDKRESPPGIFSGPDFIDKAENASHGQLRGYIRV